MAITSMSPVGVSQTQHTECSTSNSTTGINSTIPTDSGALLKTSTSGGPTIGSNDIEIPNLSVQENGDGNSTVKSNSTVKPIIFGDQDDFNCEKRGEASIPLSLCKPGPFDERNTESVSEEGVLKKFTFLLKAFSFVALCMKSFLSWMYVVLCCCFSCCWWWYHSRFGSKHTEKIRCLCKPRPFDKSCPTFEYTQNNILPPETGPSNLIDPVHEYKLMTNTENVPEKDILKKFIKEVFQFAAACMNSRTNGTIHFGVGDEPLYKHGQIIGLDVTSPKKYIDEFDKCIKQYFSNYTGIVQRCVRTPKFFRVKCPDNINVDKWVIEVDVVPMYELTLDKRFYSAFDKKGRKSKTLFIRNGASTINYMQGKNPLRIEQNEKDLKNDLKLWALSRKLAEEKYR